MNLFIKKSILFIIIFMILNYVYILIIGNYDFNFKKSVEASNMVNQSFECIALGNSLVMDGIDTQYLTNKGLSSYNLAIGGANLKTNYIQFEHYLKNNNKPKVVLLGLSSLTEFDKLRNDESIHPIVEYNYSLMDWSKLGNIPMLKFKWLATEMLKTLVSKDHRDAEIVNGQYKTKRKVADETRYNQSMISSIDDSNFYKLKYLLKIDSICNKNNVQLYILGMPGFKSTQNKFPLEFNFLIDGKRKMNVINLNNKDLIIKLLDTNNDWLGNSHLNRYGAEKITKYIFKNFLIRDLKLNKDIAPLN